MSTVVIVGWVLQRPNNLLNSLAASAIIILLWQPEQLFQPGFQLSFLLLLTMAVWPALAKKPWPDPTLQLGQREADAFERGPEENAWAKFLARVYERTTGRDPFLPQELRPFWRRKLDSPIAWLLGGMNLSLASLVCSLPVIAAYFNLISFSSVVANLVIVPLSGIALGGALASLVTGWLPYLPEIANCVSWITMKCMVDICRGLESFQWTYTYVKAPGSIAVITYYVALVCLLAGWIKRWKVALPLSVLVGTLIATALYREGATTVVTALPGSGVIFLDSPWRANDVLIDCGREREAMSVVKPFLRSRGVDRLSTIVLTHGDVEHVEGYSRLAEEFRVKTTVISNAKSRSPKYREVLRMLEADRDKLKIVGAGDRIGEWNVLHPPANEDFAKADDEAIVLAGTVGTTRLLLLSDLGRIGQDRMAQHVTEADVVMCGRSVPEVLRPALLEKAKPKEIVLTGHVPKVPEVKGVRVRTTERAVVISSEAL
jgi:competence protein ComEC